MLYSINSLSAKCSKYFNFSVGRHWFEGHNTKLWALKWWGLHLIHMVVYSLLCIFKAKLIETWNDDLFPFVVQNYLTKFLVNYSILVVSWVFRPWMDVGMPRGALSLLCKWDAYDVSALKVKPELQGNKDQFSDLTYWETFMMFSASNLF